ncbi:hypothetical protein NVIRPANT_00227 [Pantoea sp. Nvir]|nr:hypothetical protein NVIRPANT_00227 [Pantoea sp. Nvir]
MLIQLYQVDLKAKICDPMERLKLLLYFESSGKYSRFSVSFKFDSLLSSAEYSIQSYEKPFHRSFSLLCRVHSSQHRKVESNVDNYLN